MSGRVTDPLSRTLLTGAVALRWAALVWGSLALVVQARDGVVERPALGTSLLGAAAVWTVALTMWTRWRPERLASPAVLCVDVLVASALVIGDALVHRDVPVQSLGSAWPLAVVITAGVVHGWRAGAGVGLGIGAVGVVADALGERPGWLGPVGTTVLLAVGGAVAGYVTHLLRRAESEVAHARAREEVARTLHDGVLQTLAVVQRRSEDPDLARLARTQELELRRFLQHGPAEDAAGGSGRRDVVAMVRDVAGRIERDQGLRCEVVVVEPPGPMAAELADALAGAVREALTNVAKHAATSSATVCLDRGPEGGTTCTVKDDGAGLADGRLREGTGWRVSIRGRLEPLGGTASVTSMPGHGTEVTLWVP